jgi:hypothetical protein
MEKYLFTDGTNVIREVQSKEELTTLIQSSGDRNKVRIWVFNTSEWVTYAEFNRQAKPVTTLPKKVITVAAPIAKPAMEELPPMARADRQYRWLKKAFFAILAGVTVFLVYNFTRIRWSPVGAANINSLRPANVPVMDMDSLIQTIEAVRGQKLDKVTRTNLRIRNTWPDRLSLTVTSARDSSAAGIRYHDPEIVFDNSTGYQVGQAIVRFTVWKENQPTAMDTIFFKDIGYALPSKRTLKGVFKGDSISVVFSSITAPSFNFCYTENKESNYGNLNDRWFCKE